MGNCCRHKKPKAPITIQIPNYPLHEFVVNTPRTSTSSRRNQPESHIRSTQPSEVLTSYLVPKSPVVEKPDFIVLFDYEKATSDDMTIKKNDHLVMIDKSNQDWWLVKNLRTMETGYVPFNYITPIDDDLTTKEWFFPNTSRRDAERLLEYLENEPGVFLIRESEQDNGKCWSLSILDCDEKKERHAKHYRIKRLPFDMCYISNRNRFNSLDELVYFYSRNFYQVFVTNFLLITDFG
jgi:hypothetical protein